MGLIPLAGETGANFWSRERVWHRRKVLKIKSDVKLKRLRRRAWVPPSDLDFTEALLSHCVTTALSCVCVRKKNLHARAKASPALEVGVFNIFKKKKKYRVFFVESGGIFTRRVSRAAEGRRGRPRPGGGAAAGPAGSRRFRPVLRHKQPAPPRWLRRPRPGTARPSPDKGSAAGETPAFGFRTPGGAAPPHPAAPPLQRRAGLPPPPEAVRGDLKAADFQREIKIYYATHIFNRLL